MICFGLPAYKVSPLSIPSSWLSKLALVGMFVNEIIVPRPMKFDQLHLPQSFAFVRKCSIEQALNAFVIHAWNYV